MIVEVCVVRSRRRKKQRLVVGSTYSPQPAVPAAPAAALLTLPQIPYENVPPGVKKSGFTHAITENAAVPAKRKNVSRVRDPTNVAGAADPGDALTYTPSVPSPSATTPG